METPITYLVTTAAQLAEAASKLAGSSRYYLDTEFEFAGPTKKLCLVQVSRGTRDIYLIDTLALPGISPLAGAIAGSDIEWVLHAGDQDVALLQEALHLERVPRVFDTQ